MPRRSNRRAGLPFTAEDPITLENRGFSLQVRRRGKRVEMHLAEKATGRELSGKPYLYRASIPHKAGALTCDHLLDPRINNP
jgi:hypothetical protein